MTDTTTSTDPAIIIPKESALAVLTDKDQFDAFEKKIRDEVEAHVPDLTTHAGRKAIAALAFKVTKTKTAIVAAADELTEDARKQVATVNESKKMIQSRLDALRDEVRKPLTDWESAEEARVKMVTDSIETWKAAGVVTIDDTSETVAARLAALQDENIDLSSFGGHMPIAQAVIGGSVHALKAAVERLTKQEADAAELATMRREKEEREQREAEERERVEAERVEREAEEQRQRDEQAARERQEREAQEARDREEREKQEAQAREEQERVRRQEREEAEARERTEREAREKAEQEAADLRREKEEREAKEKAEADDLARRERSRAHASKIMGEAKADIMIALKKSVGDDIDEETTKALEAFAVTTIRAIVAKEIAHTSIQF